MSEEHSIPPAKRRRISFHQGNHPASSSTFDEQDSTDTFVTESNKDRQNNDDANISIYSGSKLAGQTVAPFLSKHIPEQYAPLGGTERSAKSVNKDPNTKYCYRHRPDLKCRRQANEPSMDQLQHELESLTQSDQQGIAHVWALFSAAPSKHRNLMLQGILTQCCFPQLSYLSSRVRELVRIDFLSALPTELAFRILCFLDTTSLCKATQVSQRWRSLADDDVVWHRMCEQHIDRKCLKCGWGLPLLERKRLRASKRQIQLRATGRGLNTWSPEITPTPEYRPQELSRTNYPSQGGVDREFTIAENNGAINDPLAPQQSEETNRTRPWKDVYKDRFKVGLNWRHGRYSVKSFKGHTNGIMCLQFDDNILATGSYDTTLKIWDLETGKELRALTGHTSGIRCLQFDDNKLISGSIDKTLKIWDWRNGTCLRTLTGHHGGVITLHFDSTTLVSGSMDKSVRIWNFKDQSTSVLRGHEDWVNAVKLDNASRTLFSASDDLTVRLWDLDTKATLRIFKGHVGQVQQIIPLPHEFEVADHDVANESDEHDDSTSIDSSQHGVFTPPPSIADSYGSSFTATNRALPPRYMLTGALDSTIRLWDVSTGKCLRTFFGHVEGVWALAADTLRMVSGSEDRMVKVWDPRTGKCEGTFTGHAAPVTCVGLSDSRIATGSEDCEVRLYSFKNDSNAVY